MAPFVDGVQLTQATKPLQGGSLLLTTKFPESPDTGLGIRAPGLGIQRLN